MLVNIDLRSRYKANNIFKCNFYFDPMILLDARKGRGGRGEGGGGLGFEALGPGFRGPRRCATKKSF